MGQGRGVGIWVEKGNGSVCMWVYVEVEMVVRSMRQVRYGGGVEVCQGL